MTIRDLHRTLSSWAPPATAQSYDNVGLQVGDMDAPARRVLVALDCTPQVIEEADEIGADLILAHHPVIFRPLKRVVAGPGPSGLIYELASRGIGLYACHTNLDAARGGVSFALAEKLGLREIDLLGGMDDQLLKLTTFVPEDDFEAVRSAIAGAGAGVIGEYDSCAFTTNGTGYFRPSQEANPHLGEADRLESVAEVRIEAQLPLWRRGAVLAALEEAHPYEEVAYFIEPLDQETREVGLGAIGELEEAEPLSAFLDRVASALDTPTLRYVGDDERSVRRVAVCGGSGSDFLGLARKAGADAYVTADVTYHTYFQALGADGEPEIAFIDAGHYETEAMTEELLVDWLGERHPDTEWVRTRHRTSPVRSHTT